MPNQYMQVRRNWRDVDPERDLKALWSAERMEDPARVQECLRVTELAIRVAGWDAVKQWAREQLAADLILNAQLVELAMRALERQDDAFFGEITARLREHAPPNYFRLWHTLFEARHSHRGERIFRAELAALSDFHAVKYRRWLRKIFRTLRFRCESPREKALGAIAFSMFEQYRGCGYKSEPFDAFVEASRAANNWAKTKNDKRVTASKQAEIYAGHAARLGIWSVAEGVRTAAKIPRTLEYLAAMTPKMSDGEVLRALRAFDAHLGTADHKKAPELVVAQARTLGERLGRMDVPLEEWCKILPYAQSPALVRVLEELVGARAATYVATLRAAVPFCAVPVVDAAQDARGFRVGFLLAYLLHRAHDESAALCVDGKRAVRVLSHPSALWPYGLGVEPPARRWEGAPDHPDRVGLTLVRELFPAVARQGFPAAQPLDAALRALRYRLWERATLDGESSADDVPLLVLPTVPTREERKALAAVLGCFSAAVLALIEQRWDEPAVDAPHVVHVTLPRALDRAVDTLVATAPQLAALRGAFIARKAEVDRAVRALRLAPPPPVAHVVRAPPAG